MMDKDPRLEKVEKAIINWETFKKALRRNYLDPLYTNQYRDRSFVLRMLPPFDTEMEVEYYESMQGRHYNNEWSEKPFHIRPELVILEGCDKNPFRYKEFPTERNTKDALTEDEIEESNIDDLVQEAREWFWSDLKCELPDTFKLGRVHGVGNYEVEIIWEFEE